MGFLNFLAKKSIKSTASILMRTYLKVKETYPEMDKKELFALTLSMRPSYKRQENTSVISFNGYYKIDVSKFNSIRDLITEIVQIEHAPKTFDTDLMIKFADISNEAIEEVMEEFKKIQ